jgi:hypothetical protein
MIIDTGLLARTIPVIVLMTTQLIFHLLFTAEQDFFFMVLLSLVFQEVHRTDQCVELAASMIGKMIEIMIKEH